MTGKSLLFGNKARSKMLDGAKQLERAVASTLGPKGRTVIIDDNTEHPVITKDGVSVAKSISFTDPIKNLGASIVKEAATKTNHLAGDGTTTATILATAIASQGAYLVSIGHDPNELKKGFYLARDAVIEKLKLFKRDVNDETDILNVATISANNDSDVGKVICDAFSGLGDNGIVNVLDSYSRTGKTEVKFSSGLELDSGYTSSFYSNKPDGVCEFINPKIVIFDKVAELDDIKPIINYAGTKHLPLVLIAPLFDDDLERTMRANAANHRMQCCLIRSPGFTEASITDGITDLSIILNCKVYGRGDCNGSTFSLANDFGTCESIKVIPGKTTITGANTDKDSLDKRVTELKNKLSEDSCDQALSHSERTHIEKEIAQLTGGIATIYIGADSEFEMKEKKDRYEDAVNAVRAAIEEGITPGGGTALIKASYLAQKESFAKKGFFENALQKEGFIAFIKACRIPCMDIIKSTGQNSELIAARIEANSSRVAGFNAKTEKMSQNLFDDGVIDPLKVVQTALIYATSVAALFITVDCVITDETHNVSLLPADPMMDEFSHDSDDEEEE